MTWRRRTLVAAALMVAAGACSSTDTAAPPQQSTAQPTADAPTTSTTAAPTTSSTAAPTTTTAPTTTESPEPEPTEDEAAIQALIVRYWEVVMTVNNPPNPDTDPWLGVATEQTAANLRGNTQQLLSEGNGVRSVVPVDQVVAVTDFSSLGADRALLEICLIDSAELYDLTTGDIIRSSNVVSWWQHTVVKVNQQWLVDVSTRISTHESIEACEAQFS